MRHVDVVHQLASALDADDYVTAEQLLEPNAVYESGDSVTRGAAAIIDSFRRTSQWGREHLDALEFSHEIDDLNAPSDIVFIDVLRSGDEELTLRHTMHVAMSQRGRVNRLRLEVVPGEDAAVQSFFQRHGITKRPA